MIKIRQAIDKYPIRYGTLLFTGLALMTHVLWIMFSGMAHIYDIVHAIPTVLVYDPIIKAMGGYVATEFIFIPLALCIDVLIGMLCAWLIRKKIKETSMYTWTIIGIFAIYFIIICYQWLPII